jgi:predicted permease
MFRRSPGFALAAVAALALGIGTNTAIFSVVNAVLLRPLRFPDPDRLVLFLNTTPQASFPAASPAKFAHWRQQTSVLQDVAAYRPGVVNFTGSDNAEQLRSGHVSVDFFRLFGASVVRGRSFTAAEDLPNGEKVALLSHGLWTRRFGADPGILGRTISLSGDPHVVVGIVGPTFSMADFGPSPEVWVASQLDPNSSDQGHYFVAGARLKPGTSLAEAKARIEASAGEYRARFPDALRANDGFTVALIGDEFVRNVGPALMVMLGAVSFVLLIACANVASLLLVRATSRRREIAIRAALGAGRGRIVRQLVAESVVLSLVGGGLGLALGVAGIRALLAVNTAGLPRLGEGGSLVVADWRVVAYTTAVAIGTGILCGLIPALHASRIDLNATIKEAGGPSATGSRHNRTRSVLVVAEVALALVLLVGSALLIRTMLALRTVDPGFDPDNVLTLRMSLTGPQYLTSSGVEEVVRGALERVRAVAGVESASAACCVPLERGYDLPFAIVGRPLQEGPFHGGGAWVTVSPDYFDVFRIPVKRGRVFTDRDTGAAPPAVVINEAMARQFWKDGDPLSDRLLIGKGIMREFADEQPRQIIGIVGDSRDEGLNNTPGPRMFVPQAQLPDAANALNVRLTPIAWLVRTHVEPHSLIPQVREQLRQATGLPVSDVRTMEEVVTRSTSRQRLSMLLMSFFGGAALLLAAIGIYGLMAYSVEQRTQELGIRMALGAQSSAVKRMIVFQGIRLTLVGVVIGVGSALGLTRLIASLLFGVTPWDPLVFATIPLVLTAIALMAVWLPAGRASRVNPIVALRYE